MMEYVWPHPGYPAEVCREGVAGKRALRDSTIRAVLRIWKRRAASITQSTVALSSIAQWKRSGVWPWRLRFEGFCGGSMEKLLVGLVDNKVLKPQQFQRLAAEIVERKGKAA
jgi:hypothetical protein